MNTSQPHGSGWRGARRELAVAAALALALSAAAWVLDGPDAAGLVMLAFVAVSLVVLRTLVSPDPEPPGQAEIHDDGPSQSFAGFWRTRADIVDATKSLSAWDKGLRPRMTNLLAARLAERHDISLASDPEAARRLLLRPGDRYDLWAWMDPQRPNPPDATSRTGIPPRVLAALISRLEQL